MKKMISLLFILIMISISTIGLANDVIPDSELVTRRGFFTNTDLFRGF
jgi:hypothetical protein